MIWEKSKLDSIPIHFVLCTERSGSSLLSLMFNLNENIICASEEPFALYFFNRYSHNTNWSVEDIDNYIQDFFLLADKNMALYFSKKEVFRDCLIQHLPILNWQRLFKLSYLNFLDVKDKKEVKVIIDKQIKYFFHLPQLLKIFPDAKFIILTRDVRDNVVSKKDRSLNWSKKPLFLASLWKDTYANRKYIPKSKKMTIRYEDLILDPSRTLQQVCTFFSVEFNPQMLKTQDVYENFISSKKNQLDSTFLTDLNEFHSGLKEPPNPLKIGQFKSRLDTKVISSLNSICYDELIEFGYENFQEKPRINWIKKLYFKVLSKIYRRYLLQFYYLLPLNLKLRIRRLRNKRIDV